MAVTLTKFNGFPNMVLKNKMGNLHTATVYAQLSVNVPTYTTSTREADLPADLGTAGGYTQTTGVKIGCSMAAGGTLSTATYIFKLTDKVLTATGAAIGPFRYVTIFNSTDAQKHLIGTYDYGSNITVLDGASFTIDFDATNGVFQLA
jgi:hypothetical protein